MQGQNEELLAHLSQLGELNLQLGGDAMDPVGCFSNENKIVGGFGLNVKEYLVRISLKDK